MEYQDDSGRREGREKEERSELTFDSFLVVICRRRRDGWSICEFTSLLCCRVVCMSVKDSELEGSKDNVKEEEEDGGPLSWSERILASSSSTLPTLELGEAALYAGVVHQLHLELKTHLSAPTFPLVVRAQSKLTSPRSSSPLFAESSHRALAIILSSTSTSQNSSSIRSYTSIVHSSTDISISDRTSGSKTEKSQHRSPSRFRIGRLVVGGYAGEWNQTRRIIPYLGWEADILGLGTLSRVGNESRAGWLPGGNDGVYSSFCLV